LFITNSSGMMNEVFSFMFYPLIYHSYLRDLIKRLYCKSSS